MLAAVEWGGEWHIPEPSELFEWPAFWWSADWNLFGVPLYVNRVVMLTFLAVLIAAALFLVAFRAPRVVPSKLQSFAESIVEFIREQIAIQVIGADGVKWVPFLTTIFMFVWINNLFEVVPGINFPPTSRMALPAFLSVMVYITFLFMGIKAQGFASYFKNLAFPPGVPWPIYILYTPIELISVLVVRPLTLAVRLFANMMAGHIILTMIFITIHAFLYLRPELPIGLVALVAAPLLIGFELVVGILQAYIFTILTAVYIGGALHPEH
ncbi:MAG TPA: F0F1 ATP synthase subunit A [Egibacteraceae bacterium]|nr:F0F1 ATP synthase subunit A [Egibacteraceae bacterium]